MKVSIDEITRRVYEELKKPSQESLAKIPFHGDYDAYERHNTRGFESFKDFLKAVATNDTHALKDCVAKDTDPIDTGSAPGQFIVPEKFEQMIWEGLAEQDLFINNGARVFTLSQGQGKSVKIPAQDIENLYTGQGDFGGIQTYWIGEDTKITTSTPELRNMEMTLKKLACATKATNETIFSSAVNVDELLTKMFGEAIALVTNYNFFHGNGAGRPLGAMEGLDHLEITAESSQDSNTFLLENAAEMIRKLRPGSFNRAKFIINPDAIRQVVLFNRPIGTGGSLYQALNESNGNWTLFGRPIIWSGNFAGALGSANVAMLADFTKYAILRRKHGLRIQKTDSHDEDFLYDRVCVRAIYEVDGQPINGSTLTLKSNVETASFIGTPAI
jgi:HK97 family phage major capsid protein